LPSTRCVELQATAERHAFPCSRLLEMMDDPETGIRQFHDLQRAAIAAAS
jgi:ribonuclease PH